MKVKDFPVPRKTVVIWEILWHLLWFFIPFGLMWAAGVPIEHAGRWAVFPYSCAMLSLCALMCPLALIFRTASQERREQAGRIERRAQPS